jgi:hypothetical protein
VTYEDRWFDWSVPVGLAIWIVGLAIGLTVSEEWTSRGDYALVAGIAAMWTPATVLVMRRFPSQHFLGRMFGMLGASLATVIPLHRALPASWSIHGRALVVALATLCVGAIYLVALFAGQKPRAADGSPVIPR